MLKLRDRDHVNLWRSELAVARQNFDEAVAVEKERVAEAERQTIHLAEQLSDVRGTLKANLEQRPVASVAHWYESETVTEAHRQRDAADRARDWVFQSLWRVDDAHHSKDGDERACVCGTATRLCAVWLALEPLRATLYKWEDAQAQRMNQGLDHGLAGDHPEAKRWMGKHSMLDWPGPSATSVQHRMELGR